MHGRSACAPGPWSLAMATRTAYTGICLTSIMPYCLRGARSKMDYRTRTGRLPCALHPATRRARRYLGGMVFSVTAVFTVLGNFAVFTDHGYGSFHAVGGFAGFGHAFLNSYWSLKTFKHIILLRVLPTYFDTFPANSHFFF